MITIFIVVEDKPEEQAAAFEAIKRSAGSVEEVCRAEITPGCPMIGLKSLNGDGGTQVQFAADLETAVDKIKFARKLGMAKVGVITDLMFPATRGGKEEPHGLGVIAECVAAGLPVVVCSDTDHHEVGWLRPIFPILEKAHPIGRLPVILDKKDWEQAVALLGEVMAPAAVAA